MKKSSALTRVFLINLIAITLIAPAMAQSGDITRRTVAVTYLRDPVKVALAGTTLRPTAKGEATVERWRKRNSSEIDIQIEGLVPAYNYGGDYTTYILWAITPAGQIENLGEFRLSGSSARLKTSTAHQTFAMIITAEPHYLVRLPSKKVILENLAPVSKNVQVQTSEISFTGDSGLYYTDTTVPAVAERDYNKTPPELLQARRAIQIARLADGERFAPEDYSEARRLLDQAEASFRRGASVHEVGRVSRESISLAVRARDVSEERAVAAERRAEIARRDAELRRATENATDLNDRLNDTEARLKASDLARTNAEDEMRSALREAADQRSNNRFLQAENDRLQVEVDRLTKELASSKAQISDLQGRFSDASSRLNETSSRVEAMERSERERRDFDDLRATLSRIVTVKPVGDSFVAVLPDSFFLPNKTDLSVKVKAQMDSLSQAIAAHPNAIFTIEGHSDARAASESFALGRAQSVADYIAAYNVSRKNFKVETRGATVPVSKAKSVAARASNRRVEIVFSAPR